MVRDDISIRISGEAGQGIQTIGSAFCLLLKECGLYVYAHQDYMSRIRGGDNFFQVRVSPRPLFAPSRYVAVFMPFSKQSFLFHREVVIPGGCIMVDKQGFGITEEVAGCIDVPYQAILWKNKLKPFFTNAIALGALAGILGINITLVERIITKTFSTKGEEVTANNINCARQGHHLTSSDPLVRMQCETARTGGNSKRLLLSGNDAVALGAIKAGCKFYAAYPMTPSTSIMETIAHFASRYIIVVEQAEDEIAAITMAIGASFAGVRAMTGTSGGGFALMSEGLSLAAMTETPLVIIDAQRPAPATGFPTRTEQADLDLVIHSGHGEFARVVYAPGTPEQAFDCTVKAFEIAEQYQIPVIILTDQLLADAQTTVSPFPVYDKPVIRHIISREASKGIAGYHRYAFTENGISPRAIPSWIDDPVYAVSDEHSEMGHITEDGKTRKRMVEKRFLLKCSSLAKEALEPSLPTDIPSRMVLIGFGSTYGIIREVAELLAYEKVTFLHFQQVWPLPTRALMTLRERNPDCLLVTVENNAAGQFARLIRRETGIVCNDSITKYDGRPFTVEEVAEQAKALVRRTNGST